MKTVTANVICKAGRGFFPPLGLMGLIFITSSIPMDNSEGYHWVPFISPNIQNLLHIPIYAALSFLWLRALAQKKFALTTAAILTLLISVSYGCIDEIHQNFIPGRYGGVTDVLLNAVGAIIGLVLAAFLKSHRRVPVE